MISHRHHSSPAYFALALLLASPLIFLQLGCGSSAMQATPALGTLQGTVHGGQQPVSNATIQLYAAGSSGYGSAATPLLTASVHSDANGNFAITGDYTCPTPSTQVYMTATGGNPGLTPGTDNAALAMMTALGNCGNLSSSTVIVINELTTVASVYALAPFLSSGGGSSLGSSSTNAQGLANAFAVTKDLVNTQTGKTPGQNLPAGAILPARELNSLADILAPCVNSDGNSSACSSLFSAATPGGGSAPQNTVDAMLNIAQNPANNATALFNLIPAGAPFQPTLSLAPNDWTVAVTYTGGGLDAPFFLAVDAGGNVWTSNNGNDSVTKLSPTGAAISPASGYTAGGVSGPWGIAVDPNGNVWVADANSNALTELSSTGTAVIAAPGVTAGGISNPFGIAITGAGTVWTANLGNVSAILNNGTAQLGSPYVLGGVNDCYNIAADGAGNIWITDHSPNLVSKLTNLGVPISVTGFSGGGLNAPWAIAIDAAGNAWIANNGNSSITKFDTNGTVLSGAGFIGGGLNSPQGIAIDGLGNAWIANNGNNSVTELTSAGVPLSPSSGYLSANIDGPTDIALDGSGNVWISNGNSTTVTEFIGAAAPVVTPLSVAALNNTIAVRP